MKPKLHESSYFVAVVFMLVFVSLQIAILKAFSSNPSLLLGALVLEAILVFLLAQYGFSSRRRLEAALKQSETVKERVQESDRLKRDFMTSMSHEIRAPLAAVLGFADLLLNPSISSEEKTAFRSRLRSNAEALTHLVTDLVDVAESDARGFEVKRESIVLKDFMQKVQEVFAPIASEKGLEFKVELKGEVPAVIESDSEMFMQILRHVIGNAIRYCDHGVVSATFAASKSGPRRREIGVIVSDQGEGIGPEIKRKLFYSFASRGEIGAKTHGGTGVGLTLARRLARELGGDVKLVKSNRRGSTFMVTIDAGAVAPRFDFISEAALGRLDTGVFADDAHGLQESRILVVDDSPDCSLLMDRMLTMAGAKVDTVDRGEIAVQKAAVGHYDVILMDIQMPEMDGYETIRRIRAMGVLSPIVALSAHAMREDQSRARRAGANGYLTKPVSRRALIEMLGRFVEGREAGGAPEQSL